MPARPLLQGRANVTDASASSTVLGPYRLLSRLGAGGMAEVYEAEHTGLKKRVAVKLLKKELAVSAEMRARFLREGVAASRIRHPHVVDVTDVGEADGTAYLVMELLDGEPLSALLERQARLPASQAIDLLLPITAALADAHRAGVIHRDVKPENIFLARTPQGTLVPKLLDFGISRIRGRSLGALTADEEVLGTPHYMAPEQARGEDTVDAASDQYAMAVVVYQAITGAFPHGEKGPIGKVLVAVAQGTVVVPSLPLPGIDPDLEQALLRALSARADRRFADMEQFGRALAPFATSRGRSAFAGLIGAEPSELSLPRPRLGSSEGRVITKPTILPERRRDQANVATPLRGMVAPPPMREEPTANFVPHQRLSTPMVPAPRPSPPPPPPHRDGIITALALSVMVLVMLAVGLALEPDERNAPEPHAGADVPEVIDVPPPSPPEERATAGQVTITAIPESAVIELDGIPVGIGHYEGAPPSDGVPHLVTVYAPGFVRRQFTLEGPLDHRIVLRPEVPTE